MSVKRFIVIAAAVLSLTACQEPMNRLTARVFRRAVAQYTAMDIRLDAEEQAFPKSFENGENLYGNAEWWCSGFYPGCLWYIYQYTGNEDIRSIAEKNTLKLADICEKKTHHDIGFQVNSSFGNAFRITGDEAWLSVYETAAAKLATRFNPRVGCIKSWDNKKYTYPVIIDNMMNLELLVRASELFGCDSLRQIAVTHALTTIENHFRPDASTFHLVDYDPATGDIIGKMTVQGYADETSWSRGQAWGLYGYTMMYEQTRDERFLAQARKIAAYVLPLLPEDGIPYWDFNAPGTPNAVAADAPGCPTEFAWKEGDPVLRDSSAGAIVASALVTLSTSVDDGEESELYLATAEKILRTLASREYLAKTGENGNFLLKHGVGNLHGNKEVDVPLTYADYYFLEALLKYRAI